MKLEYFIYRVSTHPKEVIAEHDGEKVAATINTVTVELTPINDGLGGSWTMNFKGAAAVEAKEKFVQGATFVFEV